MSEPGGDRAEKPAKRNGRDPVGPNSAGSVTHRGPRTAGAAAAALKMEEEEEEKVEGPEVQPLSVFKRLSEGRRVDLSGREYHSEGGKTFHLPLIGKIKQQLSADPTLCPEYPCALGLTEFNRRAAEVTLGRNSSAVVESRVLGVQTPAFTAAVRLGAELLRHWVYANTAWCGPVYLSSPCDDSLAGVLQASGIHDIRAYYYWDDQRRCVCLQRLLQDLEAAPEKSVVVLSASGHYPTGADLSHDQWAVITQLIMRRRHFPFLLLPAQGLCTGDLTRDAWPVQHCASQGMELLCAQSFSHCFGLYGEAVGHLLCVLKSSSLLSSLQAQAVTLVRALWAQPAVGGAHVIATVLSNPAHLVEWQGEVKRMVQRCMLIREVLREKLRLLGTPGCWDHLTQQSGLYCCTGLSDRQAAFLTKTRRVLLLPGGCLNVSAINGHDLKYICESVHLALTTSS